MIAYCIELDSKKPEVLELSGEELEFDMKFYNAKKPTDLSDVDRRVFDTEEQADEFYKIYMETLKSLDNKKICHSRDLPCMLYKRRYIVQSLLGEKMSTDRHYKKNWKTGDLINLHDQVFFLTVKIKKITEMKDDDGIFYRYDFELP